MAHGGDIKPPCRNIRRHQDLDFAGFKGRNRSVALALTFITVDRSCNKTLCCQKLHQFFGPVFGAPKHQRQFVAMFV